MFVVTVEFTVRHEKRANFMREMLANAKASLDNEPGCRQFDVCVSDKDPNRVFLYEIYSDRYAFDVHLTSDHFRHFDRTVGEWIVAKEVAVWQKAS